MALSPYELHREQMIEERNAFLRELFPDNELAELKRDIAPKKRTLVAPRSKSVSHMRSPAARGPVRRSPRLMGKDSSIPRQQYSLKKERKVGGDSIASRTRRSLGPLSNLALEDATVALVTSAKVYDPINGTSCHQCRQKTLDLKTTCHGDSCIGVRGQFCGPCLRNRYGEDITKVIKNKKWLCPPCREICNCSICLNRSGRRPTGILIHTARDSGFESVHSFLKAG
ncbi:cell division cycle-associated 7-like protein isoform X1 [Sycon ciliatum]|uniref:cell division cycle-associated 7-like protein isoform X1 n=1 Tax=Sycon ciliatum TaxID=27933 RepID=UPI0031F60778